MPLADLVSQLQITEIKVELPPSSSKWIQSIDIEIDKENVAGLVRGQPSTGTSRAVTAVLDPPCKIQTSLQVTVHLLYKKTTIFKRKSRSDGPFSIDFRQLLDAPSLGIGDKKEWRGEFGKLMVIVGLMTITTQPVEQVGGGSTLLEDVSLDGGELTPTTESIFRDCPYFRILVMGKTGSGKSSLINKAFGVDDAVVAHQTVGFADINKEIYSKDNPHFILHDSKGFEQGDDVNVKTVQRFIKERKNMPDIKDKLHAVWLCVDIPIDKGRLLETGIEKFLKLKIDNKLDDVPIIVIFTKYDTLITREDRLLDRADHPGESKQEIATLIEQNAQAKLQDICVKPFERFAEGKVPHITVSTEPGYEDRLSALIKITYKCVEEYLADASVVFVVAQRVSPQMKIQASIAVGRRKYWERLTTSVNFPGRTLQRYLNVIHTDIIAVWQFNDPNDYLSSNKFKAMMSNIVTGSTDQSTDPTKTLLTGVSLVAGIAGIISAVAGPAAPIVIPIAASFVLAKWVHDMYRQTTVVLKDVMTYIIDLTLILQNISWLQALSDSDRPLSRRIIKMGAHAYEGSTTKRKLSAAIDSHLKGVNLHVGPESILTAIENLIKDNVIESTEMLKYKRASLPDIDEPWET